MDSVRVGGVRAGDRALLLVSEYDTPREVSCTVTLPEGLHGAAELTPDGAMPAREDLLEVTLDEVRGRVFLLAAE